MRKQRKLLFIQQNGEKSTLQFCWDHLVRWWVIPSEKKITLKELKKDNLVIALGGGAFINSSIRREIKNSCLSFWLDLNISSILLRLKNVKKRPLLDENKLEESINEIYSQRKKFYNESNFRIKCNSKNKEETIHKIIKLYEGSRNQI